jgi:hypothetical protein
LEPLSSPSSAFHPHDALRKTGLWVVMDKKFNNNEATSAVTKLTEGNLFHRFGPEEEVSMTPSMQAFAASGRRVQQMTVVLEMATKVKEPITTLAITRRSKPARTQTKAIQASPTNS